MEYFASWPWMRLCLCWEVGRQVVSKFLQKWSPNCYWWGKGASGNFPPACGLSLLYPEPHLLSLLLWQRLPFILHLLFLPYLLLPPCYAVFLTAAWSGALGKGLMVMSTSEPNSGEKGLWCYQREPGTGVKDREVLMFKHWQPEKGISDSQLVNPCSFLLNTLRINLDLNILAVDVVCQYVTLLSKGRSGCLVRMGAL